MQYTSESVETLIEQFAQLPSIGRKTARRLASYVLKMQREDVEALADALLNVKDQVLHCSVCHSVADQDPCAICASTRRDHSIVCVVEEPSDVQAIEGTGEFHGVYHVLGGAISPLDGVGPDDLTISDLARRVKISQEEKENAAGAAGERAADAGQAPAGDAPLSTGDGAPEASADASEGSAPAADASAELAEEGTDAEEILRTFAPIEEIILAVNPNVEGDTTAYYLQKLLEPLGINVTRIARGLPIGGDLEYADEATLARAMEGRGPV